MEGNPLTQPILSHEGWKEEIRPAKGVEKTAEPWECSRQVQTRQLQRTLSQRLVLFGVTEESGVTATEEEQREEAPVSHAGVGWEADEPAQGTDVEEIYRLKILSLPRAFL